MDNDDYIETMNRLKRYGNRYFWMFYMNLRGALRDICEQYHRNQGDCGQLFKVVGQDTRVEVQGEDEKFTLFKKIRQVFYSCILSIYHVYNPMRNPAAAYECFPDDFMHADVTSDDFWDDIIHQSEQVNTCVREIFLEVCAQVYDDEDNHMPFKLTEERMPIPLPTTQEQQHYEFRDPSNLWVPPEQHHWTNRYLVSRRLITEPTWWDNSLRSIREWSSKTPKEKVELWNNSRSIAFRSWGRATVLELVDWKTDMARAACECFALKMRCDRIGDPTSGFNPTSIPPWPGQDWPEIREKMFASQKLADRHHFPYANFKGSKACYAGVTYILKYKAATLFAKFVRETVRYFLTQLQKYGNYDFFPLKVKKADILAWFQDYKNVKELPKNVEEWTTQNWCHANTTDRLSEYGGYDRNEDMLYNSLSTKNITDHLVHRGRALPRNFQNDPELAVKIHNRTIEATPEHLNGYLSRARFTFPTDCYMENLTQDNLEFVNFCEHVYKYAEIPWEIPQYIKTMYRFRFWVAFMSEVERLEMEYDSMKARELNVQLNHPHLDEIQRCHEFVIVPGADMCSNKYLLNIARPVSRPVATVNNF